VELALALPLHPGEILPNDFVDVLNPLSAERIRKEFDAVVGGSSEGSPQGVQILSGVRRRWDAGGTLALRRIPPLGRFTIDFTAQARAGQIDPIFGRDPRDSPDLDILGRRPRTTRFWSAKRGGQDAVVEGLALRIVKATCRTCLKQVQLLSMVFGLLQGGGGGCGRVREPAAVGIDESRPRRFHHLFIDEGAHAHRRRRCPGVAGDCRESAQAGAGARRVAHHRRDHMAEYKKYFETDAALSGASSRCGSTEPGEDDAIIMLRGLKAIYEAASRVTIRDDAVVAAVKLSSRYIEGRQLPDRRWICSTRAPRGQRVARGHAGAHRDVDQGDRSAAARA